MATVLNNDKLRAMLNGNITSGGVLNNCRVRLFQNDVEADPTTNLASFFTEADFVGYASLSGSWSTAYLNDDNNVEVNMGLASYTAGAVTGDQTVYGWYVTNSNGDLLASRRFDSPQYVTKQYDVVIAVPRMELTASGGEGLVT